MEEHAAPKHLGFQIGGVHPPLGRVPNPKPWLVASSPLGIIRSKRPTDVLLHQGEAVVCERPIIHRFRNQKSRGWVEISDGSRFECMQPLKGHS